MKILVVDTEGFAGLGQATRMAFDGHDVYLFTPISKGFPRLEEYAIGMGFDSFRRIYDFGELDNYDLLVFVDVGMGHFVNYLKSEKNYVVSGAELEQYEISKSRGYKFLDKIGVKVPEYKIAKGVDEAYVLIKQYNYDCWVKVDSIFRGNIDTWYAKDDSNTKTKLEELRSAIGPFSETSPIIIQRNMRNMIEVGCDVWVSKGKILKPYTVGLATGTGYILKIVEKSLWNGILEKIFSQKEASNYTGPFSLEGFMDKNKNLYVTDITSRFAQSLSLFWTKYLKNYTDFLYHIATGKAKSVPWNVNGNWLVGLYLATKNTDEWLKITGKMFDNPDMECLREWEFRRVAKVKNNYYFIPGDDLVGLIMVNDKTVDNAWKKILDIANNWIDFEGKFYDKDLISTIKQWISQTEGILY